MPMNLIEQMEILKGLSDQQLAAEMQSPTGGAAPFMVATEISRRRDMRQRYMNEAARQRPQTTVIEDIAMSMPQMGMMPPQPGMGGGIAAAAPQNAPAVQAFAEGGIVGERADPYTSLIERYQSRIDGYDGQRDRAAALALIAAGAGIMGGGHSNTLRNVGEGAAKGLDAYSRSLEAIDVGETNALRGLSDLYQAQQQQKRLSQTSYGQTPLFFEDEKGVQHLGQASDTGGYLIDGRMYPGVPAGWKVVNRPQALSVQDFGTYLGAVNPNLGAAGGTTTTVGPVDVSGKAFDTKLGADLGAQVAELRSKASEAKQSLAANEQTLGLLNNGTITGFGADFKIGFGKALQAAGFNFAKDEIANTEAFVATRAQEVGRLIQLFGAGTGLSDADRAYAEKAAAGTIDLTEESIRRVIEINNIAAQNVIERYDAIAKDLGGRGSIPDVVIGAGAPEPSASTAGAADDEIDDLVKLYSTP